MGIRMKRQAAEFAEDGSLIPQAPIKVGDQCWVRSFCYSNDMGGTQFADAKVGQAFSVTVVKAFYDYECGWRFHGELRSKFDKNQYRKMATTGLREKGQTRIEPVTGIDLLVEAADHIKNGIVYFDQGEIINNRARA